MSNAYVFGEDACANGGVPAPRLARHSVAPTNTLVFPPLSWSIKANPADRIAIREHV
jgi:hypothetical protein